MDTRGQFTFYKSYWDAIEELPAKSQLPILRAIIRYALFGQEPVNLPSTCRAVFLLVKPTLDASRKKAANGKHGGSKPKANGKQTEAPPKQTEREKEEEKENEVEIEGEEEKEKEHPALLVAGTYFTAFFDAYPNKRKRDDAWKAWKSLNPDLATVEKLLAAVDAWKKSTQWTEDGGRFIPLAVNFLSDSGYWLSPPSVAPEKPARRQMDEDELRAIQQMLDETFPDDPGDPHKAVRM